MKRLFPAMALAALALLPTSAKAQQTKLLTADRHNEYGLVYTLPTTALSVEVTARHTTSLAGPYWQYAKKYIGTDKVVRDDSEKWEIVDVKVTPYGVPDPEQRYLMQLKAGATTYIGVSEDGMILSINRQPVAPDPRPMASQKATPDGESVNLKEYLQYVDEDFISSQNSAKQAQMLAENLMEIRDAKISLTRGTADTMPTDGRQLELMLNSLSHQEASMTAAFTGLTTSETVTRTYTFTPDDNGKTLLFRMSDFAGFVDADDLSGDPVWLSVEVTAQGQLPVDEKGEEKKLPKDAVVYAIPGSARVTIDSNGKKLFSKEFDFAQFGVVFGLNPSMFSSKKEPSYAVFSDVTGAILEIGTAEE